MVIGSLSSASSSSALKWAIGSWSLFIAENLILSENRSELIHILGDDNYHILYGTCSTAAISSIVYAYRYKVRGAGPVIWTSIPPSARLASFVFHSIGLVMASQALPKIQIPIHYYYKDSSDTAVVAEVVPDIETNISTNGTWKIRCPFDFSDKYSQAAMTFSSMDSTTSSVKGLDRITRHPGLWSFACIGLGNALLVKNLPTQIWFSMPLAVATIGGYHTDSRYKRGMGGFISPQTLASTSSLPFWALLGGKQGDITTAVMKFWNDEFKGLNAALGSGISMLWVLKRAR